MEEEEEEEEEEAFGLTSPMLQAPTEWRRRRRRRPSVYTRQMLQAPTEHLYVGKERVREQEVREQEGP